MGLCSWMCRCSLTITDWAGRGGPAVLLVGAISAHFHRRSSEGMTLGRGTLTRSSSSLLGK